MPTYLSGAGHTRNDSIGSSLFDPVRNGKAGYGLLTKSASPVPATLARGEPSIRQASPHDVKYLCRVVRRTIPVRFHMNGRAVFPRRRRSDSMRASREEGICSIGGISDRMVWSAYSCGNPSINHGHRRVEGCRPLAVIICFCRRERRWLREPLRWRRR